MNKSDLMNRLAEEKGFSLTTAARFVAGDCMDLEDWNLNSS